MGTKKVEYICTTCMNTGFSLKTGKRCKCKKCYMCNKDAVTKSTFGKPVCIKHFD